MKRKLFGAIISAGMTPGLISQESVSNDQDTHQLTTLAPKGIDVNDRSGNVAMKGNAEIQSEITTSLRTQSPKHTQMAGRFEIILRKDRRHRNRPRRSQNSKATRVRQLYCERRTERRFAEKCRLRMPASMGCVPFVRLSSVYSATRRLAAEPREAFALCLR